MNPVELFDLEKRKNIKSLGADDKAWEYARLFMQEVGRFNYTYHFEWLGRPVIQLPQDLIAMQEIIWKVKPDLIIETGIALGGSLIFYASMLELVGEDGHVLGIDIDIRAHNRAAIENHPMFKRITMIQGSSVDEEIAQQVKDFSEGRQRVLVVLDSNHTHEHVSKELALYSPLVTRDSYLVVCDTLIEDVPDDLIRDRPWGKGNNPKTAVWEFLKTTDRFVIDQEYNDKLLITVAPDGYLKCIKE
jgi:cephalosporin hydroxylase